jgi:hypothetical protein
MNIISDASILVNPIGAEAQLEAIYLGSDMDAICDVAFAAADNVLIANAALPLENRRAAFNNWRKKAFTDWLRKDNVFQLYFSSLPSDVQEEINIGAASLAKIASLVSNLRGAMEKRREDARRKSKDHLRETVLSLLNDRDGIEDRLVVPKFIAIIESGEVAYFRGRSAATGWAKSSGKSFMILPVACADAEVKYITPDQAADVAAEIAAQEGE